MSLDRARQLAHNMRARATERGDEEGAEMAQLLHEVADGMEREIRDINKRLRERTESLENKVKWSNIAGVPVLVAAAGIVIDW